jgi:hypothetical protein
MNRIAASVNCVLEDTVGLLYERGRLGPDIEGRYAVGMRGVEGLEAINEEFCEGQLGVANTFHNALGQFVAAVVGVMRGVFSSEGFVCFNRGRAACLGVGGQCVQKELPRLGRFSGQMERSRSVRRSQR